MARSIEELKKQLAELKKNVQGEVATENEENK